MRITRGQLQRIIREEASRLREAVGNVYDEMMADGQLDEDGQVMEGDEALDKYFPGARESFLKLPKIAKWLQDGDTWEDIAQGMMFYVSETGELSISDDRLMWSFTWDGSTWKPAKRPR